MVAYIKPQPRKKGETEKPREEGDKIEFIYLRFKRRQVLGFWNGRRRQDVS